MVKQIGKQTPLKLKSAFVFSNILVRPWSLTFDTVPFSEDQRIARLGHIEELDSVRPGRHKQRSRLQLKRG